MSVTKFSLLLLSLLALISPVSAAYTIRNGKVMDATETATMSARDHFRVASKAYDSSCWEEAAKNFRIITANFPGSVYAQEAYYFLGVSYYFLEEYDHANDALSEYLKVQNNPRYFQSAVEFKFAIAEQFKAGARRRPFGSRRLPKWVPGASSSLQIYNEVIAAVPCHEIAAQALISKGMLLWKWRDYHEAIEAFQMVIRRFPKYEYTPDCYLYIGKIYLEQSQYEFQNSDILALAEINLCKFERDFPREERLCEAQADLMAVKETYACGLYETGRFYERKCKPRAAVIYYNDALRQVTDKCIAQECLQRMLHLNPAYLENLPPVETLNEQKIEEEVYNEDDLVDIENFDESE